MEHGVYLEWRLERGFLCLIDYYADGTVIPLVRSSANEIPDERHRFGSVESLRMLQAPARGYRETATSTIQAMVIQRKDTIAEWVELGELKIQYFDLMVGVDHPIDQYGATCSIVNVVVSCG